MTRIAFIRSLIGKKYELGASGPNTFDCFGLVSHVSGTLFERAIPREPGEMLRLRRVLARGIVPVDGAVVVMRSGDKHVGIWLAEGGILHATLLRGVTFDHPSILPMLGFGQPRYFNPR